MAEGGSAKAAEDALHTAFGIKSAAGKELSMSMMSPSRGGRSLGHRDTVQRRRGLIDCGGAAAIDLGVSRTA
jgi:hypothetical protein